MPRLLALGLAALALVASADAQSTPPSDDRLGPAPVLFLTAAYTSDAAADPLLHAAPSAVALEAAPALDSQALVLASASLLASVVEEPVPVEDPVQFQAPRAPVRMELAQTRRRVVLLPGVSSREPSPEPLPALEAAPESDASGVVYSRAVVIVGPTGQREVRYVDARAPLDLGAAPSCGDLEVGLRLRGLRSSPLRRGMRGDAVRAAQQLLCAAGFEAGNDGVYDAEVVRAVRDLQAAHNEAGQGRRLAVDGVFGYRTRQATEAAIARR